MGRLRAEEFEAKELGVTKYKESGTYKLDLETTTGLLLIKERINLWRLL